MSSTKPEIYFRFVDDGVDHEGERLFSLDPDTGRVFKGSDPFSTDGELVFTREHNEEKIFTDIFRDSIPELLNGKDTNVFLIGEEHSGRFNTVFGGLTPSDDGDPPESNVGMIKRALKSIEAYAQMGSDTGVYSVGLTIIRVYASRLYPLVGDSSRLTRTAFAETEVSKTGMTLDAAMSLVDEMKKEARAKKDEPKRSSNFAMIAVITVLGRVGEATRATLGALRVVVVPSPLPGDVTKTDELYKGIEHSMMQAVGEETSKQQWKNCPEFLDTCFTSDRNAFVFCHSPFVRSDVVSDTIHRLLDLARRLPTASPSSRTVEITPERIKLLESNTIMQSRATLMSHDDLGQSGSQQLSMTASQLKDVNEEIVAYIETQKKRSERQKQLIHSLSAQLTEAKIEDQHHLDEIRALNRENKKTEKVLNAAIGKLRAKIAVIEELETTLARQEEETELAAVDAQNARNEVEAAAIALNKSEAMVAAAQKELDEAKELAQKAMEDVEAKAAAAVEAAKAEAEAAMAMAAKGNEGFAERETQHAAALEELQKKLSLVAENEARAVAEVDALRGEVDGTKQLLDIASTKHSDLEETIRLAIAEKESEVEIRRKETEKYEAVIAKHQSDLEKTKSEFESAVVRAKEAEEFLQASKEALASLEMEHSECASRLEIAVKDGGVSSERFEAMERERAELLEELAGMKDKLEQSQTQVAAANAAHDDVIRQVGELEKRLEEEGIRRAEVEQEALAKGEQLKSAEANVAASAEKLAETLERLDSAMHATELSSKDSQEKLEEATRNAETATKKLTEVEQQLAAETERAQALSSDLLRAMEEKKNAEALAQEARIAHNKESESIKKSEDEVKKLRGLVDQKTAAQKRAETALAEAKTRVEGEMTKLRAQLTSAQSETKAATDKLAESTSELASLRKINEEAVTAKERAVKALEALESKYGQQQKAMDHAAASLKHAEAERDGALEGERNAVRQMEEKEREHENLTDLVAKLREERRTKESAHIQTLEVLKKEKETIKREGKTGIAKAKREAQSAVEKANQTTKDLEEANTRIEEVIAELEASKAKQTGKPNLAVIILSAVLTVVFGLLILVSVFLVKK